MLFIFSKERVDVLVKWMHHHAFDDILSIIEHMVIDPEKNMDSMTKYKSGKQMHDLHVNTSQQIKLLAHWFRQTSIDIQGIPSKATWMNLTKAEFDLWRINTDFRSGSSITDPVSPMKSPSHSTSPKSFSTTSAASQSQLDLTAFKKGTKRDAMAYETFKDERYYDTFWRTFKTTAKAQGLSNVLDFRYKPPTNDTYAAELFQEQQIFLYSVLVRIIQTDQGRAYVREHEHDEDARAVLQKLHTDRVVCNLNLLLDLPYDHGPDNTTYFSIYADANGEDPTLQHASVHRRYVEEHDWKQFRPFFGWQSEEVIADTFKHTTRHANVIFDCDTLKKHFKARNPILNLPRRHEPVATNSIFSDTPAVDHGGKVAQIFVGRDTLVTDIYGIKSTKQFVNTLQDNIRMRGVMETLISDGGSSLISHKVKDILRTLLIGEYRSEPYHQHQNKAENRYQTVKRMTNAIMNATGCPANVWLLCLEYVCDLLNHSSSHAHSGRTPIEALTGHPPDISHLLFFPFWDEVYYRVDPSEPSSGPYPSSTDEKLGHWVGFAHNVGDAFTWKILSADHHILYHSAVRRVASTTPNLRVDRPSGETSPKDDTDKQADTVFIRSKSEDPSKPMPTIDYEDMIGRTFLCDTEENGERHRVRVVKKQVVDLNEESLKQEVHLPQDKF